MAQPTHPSPRGEPSTEDHGTADVDELAAELGRLARLLEAEDDTAAMLEELVSEAVRLVPGAQEASLGVVTGRRQVTSQHPTATCPA